MILGSILGVAFLLLCPWQRVYSVAFLLLVPALIAVGLVGGWQTLRTTSKPQPDSTWRLWVIAGYLGAVLLSAVGVAVGRAITGPVGFSSRYGWIAAQLLVALYLGALVCRPRGIRSFVPLCLFFLSLVFLPGNWREGELWGSNKYRALSTFCAQVQQHLPLPLLSAAGVPAVTTAREELEREIPHLRSAKVFPFEGVPAASTLQESLLETPHTVAGNGREPLTIPIKEPSPLAGVVVRYTFPDVTTVGTDYRITGVPASSDQPPVSVTLPYRGIGVVLLRPQGALKRLEIQPVPNAHGTIPGDLTIDSVTLFAR